MQAHATLLRAMERWLGNRRLPLIAAVLAIVICAPSLWLGWVADDYILRVYFSDPPVYPEWSGSPLNAFGFFFGDEEANQRMMASGSLPWWTTPDFRVAFLRPLSSLLHWLDFRLWPTHPFWMHLHSLLWLAAAVAAAGLLYRRILGAGWIAGLAALLFALDDAHGLPAMWIANRNTTVSVLFGIAALIAHDAWRRRRSTLGAVAAPVALAAALLAGENAVAVGAYLVSYAFFLDSGPWPRRSFSLLPCAAVGAVWATVYAALGYGASGSGLYIDPVADPLRFAGAVVERAPLLLMGQFAFPSDVHALLSEEARALAWLTACAVALVVALLALPLLRRAPTARFFAAGMLLSIVPACATFPSDRLLFFSGIGGMGLLAQILGGIAQRADWFPGAGWGRRCATAVALALAALHIPLAPLNMLRVLSAVSAFGQVIDVSAASFPSDPSVRGSQVLVMSTPSAFISNFAPTIALLEGRAVGDRGLVLGSGVEPIRIERPDAKTIVVQPLGGYLKPGGRRRPGLEGAHPALDLRYMYPMFDVLYRDAQPMRPGERIPLGDVSAEIMAVTDDGRPETVAFHFATVLEDSTLRWLHWRDGVYAPFEPPPIGASTTLPAVTVPFPPPRLPPAE